MAGEEVVSLWYRYSVLVQYGSITLGLDKLRSTTLDLDKLESITLGLGAQRSLVDKEGA